MSEPTSKDNSKLEERIRKVYSEGKLNDTIELCNKTLEQDAANKDAWNYKSLSYYGLKEYHTALNCIDMFLQLDSKSADGYYTKFLILLALKRIDEAKACCHKAAELDHIFYSTMIFAGAENSLTDGRYDDAIVFLEVLNEMGLNDRNISTKKAKALAAKQRFEEGLSCLEPFVPSNPNDFEFWTLRGVIMDGLRRHEEAIKCYDRCLEINPSFVEAMYSKGYDFYLQSKYEKALEIYDQALKIDTYQSGGWYNKGVVFGSMGRHEDAVMCFTKSVELDPANYDAWFNRGIALYELGKYTEALLAYDEALRLKADFAAAWYHKGVIIEKLTKSKSRWSLKKTSTGDADQCFKRAKELGFQF